MYKALKSFGGIVSMKKGDIKPINDINIANDLLNAGYIEVVKEEVKNIETNIKIEETQEKIQAKKTKTSKKKK